MSTIVFIRAWPRDPTTGVVVPVKMAGGGSYLPYYLDGLHYAAGIAQEPKSSAELGFSETGWTGRVVPTVSGVSFSPADPDVLDYYAGLFWRGAAIEVDIGEEATGVARALTGTVADAPVRDGALVIAMADLSQKLDAPFATDYFQGSGDIEGAAVAEGRLRRRSFGRVFNVEGRPFDPANNIYEFGDIARSLQDCVALRDKGKTGYLAILGWQGSILATLNALKASSPPSGGGVFAPSIACAKWWRQPAGPLTADLLGEIGAGYVETAGGIAASVLASAGGPIIANLAETLTLRPAVCGLHIGDASETTSSALDRLLSGVSLLWRLNPAGTIDIRDWSFGTFGDGAEVLQGLFIGRERTIAPTRIRRLGYQRNQRQHSEGEIAVDLPDSAGAFTLVNLANTTVGMNSIEKTGGSGGAWDASAHTAERFIGGCSLSFTLPQTNKNIFVGLNSDPNANASYDSIDHAIFFRSDGTIAAWLNGGGDVALGLYEPGMRFQLHYDNRYIRWIRNGELLRTLEVGPGLSFALDTSFLDLSGRVESITFAGAGSAGAPGARGDDGVTYYEWVAYADKADGTYNFTTGAPGGRTYQGRSPGKTSPTESSDPADYQWSAYVGPPNFGLVAGANMIVSGARLFKSGGGYAWDSQVYSSESFTGGAYVSFRPEIADQMMIGLNTDPTANASYDSIDHAIYVSSAGYWDCRTNNGATIVYTGSGWVLGDTFALHYRGNAIDFKKNGVTVYSIAATVGQTFWLDSSFTQQGHNATILAWAAAGAAGTDGDPGDPGYAIAPAGSPLQVQCNAAGVPLVDELPQAVTLTLLRGAVDLSTDGATDFSLISSDSAGSFSFSGTNDRTFTVTSAPADSFSAVVGAYRSGVLVQQHPISVRKVKNGAAAASDYRSTTSWTNASSSSYGSSGSGSFEFSVGNSGNIAFDVSIAYYPSVSSGTMVAKVQERIFDTGTSTWGAWTDISSEFVGTLSAPGEPGEINVSFNHTITSASIRSYKVLTRRQSGSGALTTSGTFAGTYT